MSSEVVEIRNEGDRSFYAKACRTKVYGRLYIHIGTKKEQIHGKPTKILPNDYELLEVERVA